MAAVAACSGSSRQQLTIGPPPPRDTHAVLAGALCGDNRCTCRGNAPGDGGVGVPETKDRKRYEIRMTSAYDLWVTLNRTTVLYKSPERAEVCFYVDLPSGAQEVELRAENPGGVSAGLQIHELGTKTRVGQSSGVRVLPPRMPRCARGWNRRAGRHHRMSAVSAGVRWVDIGVDPSLPSASAVVAGYASSNQNATCGGSRAGAKVAGVHGSPRGASTARAMTESTMTATTLRRPPHVQDSTSVANTRRNNSAHGPPARRATERFSVARRHQPAELLLRPC